MKKESKYFTIEYSNEAKTYITKLLDKIDIEAKKILDFFEIQNIDNKFYVKLIPTKKEFSHLIEEVIHFKDNEYGIGFVNNKIMYCLSFNDYKNTFYSFYNFDNFISTIIHEFVHSCHQLKTNNKSSIRCISEGLACYLSNQLCKKDFVFNASIDDIVNDKYIDYDNYYLIVKYIFDNYDKKYCDRIIYDKDFARSEIVNIYNSFKESIRK